MGYGRSALALAALLAVGASPISHGHAPRNNVRQIVFQLCNDTIDTAFFAVAYEAGRASRDAQGWTKVDPGQCNIKPNLALSPGGWFSYYVITQSGKNYRAGPNDFGEQICARPDDFSLQKAAASDRLGSGCPAGYDMLNFRKVDAADVRASTFTVRLKDTGLSPQRS